MHRADALQRITDALGRPTYLVPTVQVDGPYRAPLETLARWMAQPDFDGDLAVAMIRGWREEGRLDEERMWSALSVVATHPKVRDYREASRCIALQENAAMARSGEELGRSLASVERHRGVLAFSMGRPSVALECFIRALEKERTSENLGNVLAALVRTGEVTEALDLLHHVRRTFPGSLADAVDALVSVDEDLAPLRDED